MHRALVTLLLLLATAASAGGQTPAREVDLMAGWAGFPDESIVNHGNVGAALRFPISRRLSLGPEITFMIGPGRDRDIFIDALATLNLRNGDAVRPPEVMPYVIFCGGVLFHHSRHQDVLPGWTRSASLAAGAGLRARLNDRWSAGAETRAGMRGLEVSAVMTVALR